MLVIFLKQEDAQAPWETLLFCIFRWAKKQFQKAENPVAFFGRMKWTLPSHGMLIWGKFITGLTAGFAIPDSYEDHLRESLLSGLVCLPGANELPLIAVKDVMHLKLDFPWQAIYWRVWII